MENSQNQGKVEAFHLPEWETTSRHRGEREKRSSTKERAFLIFNRIFPGHRKYLGLSRKIFCVAIVVILLLLLALILGLAIGLSKRSRYLYIQPQPSILIMSPLIEYLFSQHQQLPLGSQTYTGDLTYYGPGLGACGITSSDSDHIVSISHFTFDAVSKGSNPNANPLCGHKLRALRDGNSIDLTVVDRCMTLSEYAFARLIC